MILQTLNKEVLKNYKEPWDEIKNKIVTINDGKASEYGKKSLKKIIMMLVSINMLSSVEHH